MITDGALESVTITADPQAEPAIRDGGPG